MLLLLFYVGTGEAVVPPSGGHPPRRIMRVLRPKEPDLDDEEAILALLL